jgi:hypothetical protein
MRCHASLAKHKSDVLRHHSVRNRDNRNASSCCFNTAAHHFTALTLLSAGAHACTATTCVILASASSHTHLPKGSSSDTRHAGDT